MIHPNITTTGTQFPSFILFQDNINPRQEKIEINFQHCLYTGEKNSKYLNPQISKLSKIIFSIFIIIKLVDAL